MNNIGAAVRRKMLGRLKRALHKLEQLRMEMPNEEIRADIELHRQLINFLLRRM